MAELNPTRYYVPPNADEQEFLKICLQAFRDKPDLGLLEEAERLEIVFGVKVAEFMYGQLSFRPRIYDLGPIVLEEEEEEPEPIQEHVKGYVWANRLFIRSEPEVRTDTYLGSFEKDETFVVLDQESKKPWIKIVWNVHPQGFAWIHGDYVILDQ